MRSGKNGKLRRDWVGKSSAGLVLGFGLALALSGIFAWLGPGGVMAPGGRPIFIRILIEPIWMMVLGFVFLFPSGRHAWQWLLLANLLAFAVLFACRYMLG